MLRLGGSVCLCLLAYLFISFDNRGGPAGGLISDGNPLANLEVGSYGLRVLSPTMLELTLITTKESDPAKVSVWDFVNNLVPNLPAIASVSMTANSQPVVVSSVGFKRRPIYAPLKQRDLRIGNYLYLKLATPLADGTTVEVKNPLGNLWTAPTQYVTTNDTLRYNPALHVNQVGYMPSFPKKAMVGYYLGSLGELDISTNGGFRIVKASDGSVVFAGALRQRADVGYTYTPAPYQKVYEADFSAFATPGEYRLMVPGMGASFPFMIDEGTAATFARTFALGLYHQRCGTDMDLPFTRHEHGFCHTNLVEIPTAAFADTQAMIASKTEDAKSDPRHTAPRMTGTATSLYPFVRQGKIDVSKGHHDAGDYSKYTINSAGLIHHLVFAADSFAGAGALDNLGIPESGDGKSDLLQEAKWEADYLVKMQDSDGGFYFLVYPKTREYEDDVTPDHGDAQVVWPKTTSVTAAATAALAEIASSPRFKAQFPVEAALYLAKAQLGWNFLTNAIARFGKDGAYQKITHYGNEFRHDDELAWAAAAMFAATGNAAYHTQLMAWFPNPNSTDTRRWGWWRMFEGYGCAVRTYAFAARSGRLPAASLNSLYLSKCNSEIIGAADDLARFSTQNAYGTSFPDPNKENRNAGWFFSSERAFDITVAYQITPKPEYKEAVFANVNYEAGCNPVNVAHVTGLGWKRQRDVVHQYAQNDRRVLPPTGIPLGNITSGFAYLYHYKSELTALTFPGDNVTTAPYPYYDRWADSFNTTAEFVVMDEARSLGSLAFWMAQSTIATQAWKSAAIQITGVPAQLAVGAAAPVSVAAAGISLAGAQVVWESKYVEPDFGGTYQLSPKYPGDTWIEVEALLPDGRRLFAKTNFVALTGADTPPNAFQDAPVAVGTETAAVYHLDSALTDATGRQPALTLAGGAALDISNVAWMTNRSGGGLRFIDLGDRASVAIPSTTMIAPTTTYVSVEAMIYINDWKAYNRDNATILSLQQGWNAYVQLVEDKYSGPFIKGGTAWSHTGAPLKAALELKKWHHLSLRLDKTGGYVAKLNGAVIASAASTELGNWNAAGVVTLQFGDFDGWIDEVVVRSSVVSAPPSLNTPPTVTLAKPNPFLTAPATMALSATAADANGTVAKVEFYSGAIKLGEDTTSPFTYSWTGVAAGTYALTARAIDNQGAATISAVVNATVNSAGGGGGGSSSNKASFVKTDVATKGNWRGVYGAQGFSVSGSGQTIPAYVALTQSGSQQYLWSDSTTETRALQKSTGTGRVASVWYAADSFNIDFAFNDTIPHRVSVYVMDWDGTGRSQKFEVIDAISGAVLNTTQVSDFAQGKYLTWDLTGKVRLRVSRTAGNNAVVEGIFFDVAPLQVAAPKLRIVKVDANGVHMEVSGPIGVPLVIQSTSDMTNWTTWGQVTLAASPSTFLDDRFRATPGVALIYRIGILTD
jgi:hypothetical protein